KARTYVLHRRPPVTGAVAAMPPEPAVTTEVVDATTEATIAGTPDSRAVEDDGPVRRVVRIDGRYGDLLRYTTRITTYAGAPQVRIDHILKNSVRAEQVHVKLRSATVTVGTGPRVRLRHPGGIAGVRENGATLELLPATMPCCPGLPKALRRPGAMDVDPNGGMVIPDLTHYSGTLVLNADPAAAAAPLHPMAPPAWYAEHGHLSSDRHSTLDDEKAAYAAWGLRYDPDRVPTYPHTPDYFVNAADVDIEQESESDDCWQNVMMYVRSGIRGYYDRARGWCRYMREEMAYRTDGFDYAWDNDREKESDRVTRRRRAIPLTPADEAWLVNFAKWGSAAPGRQGSSHVWGYGLADWYKLTGDPEALAALDDIVERVARFNWRSMPDGDDPVVSGRKAARNWMVVISAVEMGLTRWRPLMEKFATGYRDSPNWRPGGAYLIPSGSSGRRYVNPHHYANVMQSHDRYHALTGADWARQRMVESAEFFYRHALHPVWLHSDKSIRFHPSGDVEFPLDEKSPDTARINPYHTLAWVDTMVRGWRLTGEPRFLERARFMYHRATTHRYAQLVMTPPVRPDGEVGAFVNARPSRVYFEDHGRLQFTHLLFGDWMRSGLPPDLSPSLTLTASTASADYGAAVRLAWAAERATACEAGVHWSGTKPTKGTETVGPLRATKGYVLTCRNDVGIATRLVRVDVAAAPARNADPGRTILYYSLDAAEIDDATLVDRSGHGRNGTRVGAAQDGDALRFAADGWIRSQGEVKTGPRWAMSLRFLPEGPQTGVTGTLFSLGRPGYRQAVKVEITKAGDLVTTVWGADAKPHTVSVPAPARWATYRIEVRPGDSRVLLDGAEVGRVPTGASIERVAYWGIEMTEKHDRAYRGLLDEVRLELLP
ncbi:MAG TPA: hypothetical protein VNN07_08405, partial [Candidatus Tectomicrobia bacterium]|nr:hypothetical protein [Candidatus Tectomicrobia bacterium]